MWGDGFDADLPEVVPGAMRALGETAAVPLLTYSRVTGGAINCPAAWNTGYGLMSFFWTAPEHQPDESWWTDEPVVPCTFGQAVRDEWVHSCIVAVNGRVVWEPPARAMERLMYDLRGWAPLEAAERSRIRAHVLRGLVRAAAVLGKVTAGRRHGNETERGDGWN